MRVGDRKPGASPPPPLSPCTLLAQQTVRHSPAPGYSRGFLQPLIFILAGEINVISNLAFKKPSPSSKRTRSDGVREIGSVTATGVSTPAAGAGRQRGRGGGDWPWDSAGPYFPINKPRALSKPLSAGTAGSEQLLEHWVQGGVFWEGPVHQYKIIVDL